MELILFIMMIGVFLNAYMLFSIADILLDICKSINNKEE